MSRFNPFGTAAVWVGEKTREPLFGWDAMGSNKSKALTKWSPPPRFWQPLLFTRSLQARVPRAKSQRKTARLPPAPKHERASDRRRRRNRSIAPCTVESLRLDIGDDLRGVAHEAGVASRRQAPPLFRSKSWSWDPSKIGDGSHGPLAPARRLQSLPEEGRHQQLHSELRWNRRFIQMSNLTLENQDEAGPSPPRP